MNFTCIFDIIKLQILGLEKLRRTIVLRSFLIRVCHGRSMSAPTERVPLLRSGGRCYGIERIATGLALAMTGKIGFTDRPGGRPYEFRKFSKNATVGYTVALHIIAGYPNFPVLAGPDGGMYLARRCTTHKERRFYCPFLPSGFGGRLHPERQRGALCR